MEIQVIAHCLLNPHTRVKGLSLPLFEPRSPLIQLPCPEALYLGLDRWAVTRNQLDILGFRRFCRSIAADYVDLMEMMAKSGMVIKIIGVGGSPSCGIETTSAGYEGGRPKECHHEHIPGKGIFMEELTRELERREVAFVGMEAGRSRCL
jgi:predicted secreted protein